MFDIKNPINPSTTFTTRITTRDSGGNLIYGPSLTNVYTIKQIGTNDLAFGSVTSEKIADGAITFLKPAESFMKRVTLLDNAGGHAAGWDPNLSETAFTISDPHAFYQQSFVSISVTGTDGDNVLGRCFATPGTLLDAGFQVLCEVAPPSVQFRH